MTTTEDATSVAEVLAAEDERVAAINDGDWVALAATLHDRLVYNHMNGGTENKAELIQGLENGRRIYRRSELSVQVFGDAAVMNGILEIDFPERPDGTPARSVAARLLQFWHRSGGRWQLVGGQATPLPV